MRTRVRRGWWIALALALLAIAGLLLAPTLIERLVESRLADMPGGYRASMERAELRILEAEVVMHGFRIEKKSGDLPVPFLQAREFVLGTVRDSWKPRTTLRAVEPVVNIVDASAEANKQTGPKTKLEDVAKQLPFELSAVFLEHGELHFRNYEAKPAVDLAVAGLDVAWTKLVGCMPPGSDSCRSELRASADLPTRGRLGVRGSFQRDGRPVMKLRANVHDLAARSLTPLLRHYAKLDIERGTIDLDVHYSRRGGGQFARVVPRLHDFEILGSESEGTKLGRELGAALAAKWFERKEGKKAIELRSKAEGGFSFELVDNQNESADSQDR